MAEPNLPITLFNLQTNQRFITTSWVHCQATNRNRATDSFKSFVKNILFEMDILHKKREGKGLGNVTAENITYKLMLYQRPEFALPPLGGAGTVVEDYKALGRILHAIVLNAGLVPNRLEQEYLEFQALLDSPEGKLGMIKHHYFLMTAGKKKLVVYRLYEASIQRIIKPFTAKKSQLLDYLQMGGAIDTVLANGHERPCLKEYPESFHENIKYVREYFMHGNYTGFVRRSDDDLVLELHSLHPNFWLNLYKFLEDSSLLTAI